MTTSIYATVHLYHLYLPVFSTQPGRWMSLRYRFSNWVIFSLCIILSRFLYFSISSRWGNFIYDFFAKVIFFRATVPAILSESSLSLFVLVFLFRIYCVSRKMILIYCVSSMCLVKIFLICAVCRLSLSLFFMGTLPSGVHLLIHAHPKRRKSKAKGVSSFFLISTFSM